MAVITLENFSTKDKNSIEKRAKDMNTQSIQIQKDTEMASKLMKDV